MEVGLTVFSLILTVAVVGFLRVVARLYHAVVTEPQRLRAKLMEQGIGGPPSKFLLGNLAEFKMAAEAKATGLSPPASHDCGATVLPFLERWTRKYGDLFLFALGTRQVLLVNQPEMVREITTCTSLDLGIPTYLAKDMAAILGQGILTSNGSHWAYQRKMFAPELYMDKVKGMFNHMSESTITLINTWRNLVDAEGGVADINIDEYLRRLSGDIISKACFGSNFSKGEEIFKNLRALQEVSYMIAFMIPAMRYVPIKLNREAWALEKEVRRLILEVVKERDELGYKQDLFQTVLEAAKKSDLSQDATNRFIVDNCKNIYFAGHESSSVAASWCLMLLATNPEWQERVRIEILEICQGQNPNVEMILKMKQLSMVINETLRLYPPASLVTREALKDLKFGEVTIPKGVYTWTSVTKLHTDPENWGPDSFKFNPERFSRGLTGACKLPHLYMPFGVGPRICLGQNLALLELKILISLLIANFSFSISPKYIHSPTFKMVTEPAHGVDLLVMKL